MVDVTEKERADKVLTLIIASICFVHWDDQPAETCLNAAELFVAEANKRGYGLADIFGE